MGGGVSMSTIVGAASAASSCSDERTPAVLAGRTGWGGGLWDQPEPWAPPPGFPGPSQEAGPKLAAEAAPTTAAASRAGSRARGRGGCCGSSAPDTVRPPTGPAPDRTEDHQY